MKPSTPFLAALVLLATAGGALAEPDRTGCTDHPLFPTRMPGFHIADCKSAEYEGYDFFLPKGKKNRQEGRFTFITHSLSQGKADASGTAVMANYRSAIERAGGTIAASDPQRWVNGTVQLDGKEAWAQAEKGNGKVWLRIVEKTAMKQYIVLDAAAPAPEVAAELVRAHGIDAVRLKGYGVGPLAPVAGNDAEDARARNRRVELVKASG